MDLPIKTFLSLSLAFICLYSDGLPEEKAKLFSYQKVLDAQFACDPKMLQALNLDPQRHFNLAPKAWSVISDVKLTERPATDERLKPYLAFTLSFRGRGYFECGKEVQGLDQPCGREVKTLPIVPRSFKREQYADLINDDDPSTFREGWLNFTSNKVSTDMPFEPGTRGLTCLVHFEELLKNPNLINLNKLCEGKPEKEREKTKGEIAKAIQIWKSTKCKE